MTLSDVSVRRPVFASVISLLLIAFGALSFMNLPLRELPNIDPPVVSVQTSYRGASAAVIESRITQPIEGQLAGIEGIDVITSSSADGRSNITIEFTLDRDIEAAANDVRDAVSRIVNELPEGVDPPQVEKADADSDVIMWLNLASSNMSIMELSDYADRYVVDRLSTVSGVSRVNLGGAQRYSMRIWLDRTALAARGLTVTDVETALRAENVELPAGRLESETRDFTVRLDRAYRTADEFAALPVSKGADGHVIRLGEVAKVEVAPAQRRVMFRGNGVPQVGLGIVRQSTANTLDVAEGIKAQVREINATLPEGMELVVGFDSSIFVAAAVNEVYRVLIEALIIVVVVIFLFLGTIRAALIPAVTVPVCLMGAFIALDALGLSINLLTLLALVLAIGLVVDDAIVVLENVQRRIGLGEPPAIAAARGTKQVAFAVIATTTVLIVVFVPILFLQGNVGRLFYELAIAISAAIFFSGLVALTLTPMMCSKLLSARTAESRLSRRVEAITHWFERGYRRALGVVVDRSWVAAVVVLAAFAAIYGLLRLVPTELAPNEDRARLFVQAQGPEGNSFDATAKTMLQIEAILLKMMEESGGEIRRIITRAPQGWGGGEDFSGGNNVVVLAPWGERDRTADEIQAEITRRLAVIPGMRANATSPQGFGQRGGNNPLSFILLGNDYDELIRWRDLLLARLADNPRIVNPQANLRETRPQFFVEIDKERAADLGVSVQQIGRTLETMMGSRRVTTYSDRGEEYDVYLQATDEERRGPQDLTNVFVRSESGALIPLASVIRVSETAGPSSLARFNRLRAITINAGLAPGYALGDAIAYIETAAREVLPDTARFDYGGATREYMQSSSALYVTFGIALLVVFLVLAAQFESFVHPMVILLTVPLGVAGALFGLWAVGSSLNIYSQIGIVILIGLASKNGILIVEFVNQLRDEGRSFRDAVIEASAIRFRPIVMTSLATVAGAVPIALATGAGAASRETIGIVIVSGVSFATLLTLFVIPAAYMLLARRTGSPLKISHEMEAWERAEAGRNGGAAPSASPAE